MLVSLLPTHAHIKCGLGPHMVLGGQQLRMCVWLLYQEMYIQTRPEREQITQNLR